MPVCRKSCDGEQRRTPVIDGLLQLEEVFRVRQKVELCDHFYKTFLRLWRLPPTFNSRYFCTTKQQPQSSVRVDVLLLCDVIANLRARVAENND